mgnify:CR=1 FL=1
MDDQEIAVSLHSKLEDSSLLMEELNQEPSFLKEI